MIVKKIILVDIDGVLIDFNKGLYDNWKKKHPSLPIIELNNLTKHDQVEMYKDIDPSYEILVREIFDAVDFFDDLDPIKGSLVVLDQMEKEGYEVFLCTVPLRKFDNSVGKYHWIKNHFGEKWARRIIFAAKDKTLIRGDILIDDKPNITGLLNPTWTHILFDQPYNRHQNNPRICDWSEWKYIISDVLLNK